ncbi:hypothetical protein E3N88_05311 [Mikania micrantha]|uniref:DUF506 domain-containing protein n=1 Tax=Mikania micrantha TaxID=192012 RepID=A0A5N6PMJ4_9ASTR|nr:hypothetical protein E3N88_05311 [Mikania micrantha]
MAKIPVRFKRITAALDDDARARLCRSSGSEHSANSSVTNLSDLVDSFFDGEDDGDHRDESGGEIDAGDYLEETEYQKADNLYGSDSDTKEVLIDLMDGGADDEDAHAIRAEVESVCLGFENSSSEGFKRRLMTVLRQRGFDAGLCKSRWEKTGRHPAGEFEYIDVLISGNRYIVEVSIGSEFTIARPTKTYQSLLDIIPRITVIKPNELKKVVRIMCAAMRASLKTRNMLVSPWRKNGFMQTKWLGSYKRTTNPFPARSMEATAYGVGKFNGESFVGFEYLPAVVGGENYCRKEVGRMHVVGNLKALMSSGMS